MSASIRRNRPTTVCSRPKDSAVNEVDSGILRLPVIEGFVAAAETRLVRAQKSLRFLHQKNNVLINRIKA